MVQLQPTLHGRGPKGHVQAGQGEEHHNGLGTSALAQQDRQGRGIASCQFIRRYQRSIAWKQ